MSTNYFHPIEGITSIRIEEGETHDRVTIWQNHGNAGTLTVEAGYGRTLVHAFASERYDHDGYAPMSTHYGGVSVGAVVTEHDPSLEPDLCLISEYGEPLTVAEIRARAGHGKGATGVGGIGELFGYGRAC